MAPDGQFMHQTNIKLFIFPIGMMFVGDLLQLQPVKGRFIFDKPKDLAHAAFFEDKSLWHSLETVTLKHNHRQGEGSNWTQTLNRMRIGEPSEEDLPGFQILKIVSLWL